MRKGTLGFVGVLLTLDQPAEGGRKNSTFRQVGQRCTSRGRAPLYAPSSEAAPCSPRENSCSPTNSIVDSHVEQGTAGPRSILRCFALS